MTYAAALMLFRALKKVCDIASKGAQTQPVVSFNNGRQRTTSPSLTSSGTKSTHQRFHQSRAMKNGRDGLAKVMALCGLLLFFRD